MRVANMTENNKLKIIEIVAENIYSLQEMYNDFTLKAIDDYKFEGEPIPFHQIKELIVNGHINALILNDEDQQIGFMFYVAEHHGAIQVNLLYMKEHKGAYLQKLQLLNYLKDKFKDIPNWNNISYIMNGIEKPFTREIPLAGFKLIGQAVVKFTFNNAISLQIVNKLIDSENVKDYTVECWNDKYLEDASIVINEAFKDSKDSNFEPRYKTVEGCLEIVENITSGLFGKFLPEETTMLLHEGNLTGVCFAITSQMGSANIPLVGIKKDHKRKGLGIYLLKSTILKMINSVISQKIFVKDINATVETDNYSAIKMYRKVGFIEFNNYTHAYFTNLAN